VCIHLPPTPTITLSMCSLGRCRQGARGPAFALLRLQFLPCSIILFHAQALFGLHVPWLYVVPSCLRVPPFDIADLCPQDIRDPYAHVCAVWEAFLHWSLTPVFCCVFVAASSGTSTLCALPVQHSLLDTATVRTAVVSRCPQY
jgi:hypothetical protein